MSELLHADIDLFYFPFAEEAAKNRQQV